MRATRLKKGLRLPGSIGGAMSIERDAVLFSFLVAQVLLTFLHPGGMLAYLFPSACWTFIALTTIRTEGSLRKILSRTRGRIAFMALLSAAFQIFILVDAGLINGFGRSPLSFEPAQLAINALLVTATLLGTELSRGHLTRTLFKRRPTLKLASITLLYTLAGLSIRALFDVSDPLAYSKFMGKTFLPTLSQNLLATYVSMIGGPAASLAYRAPLEAFRWFSPILPDLPWGYESIIGVMTPTVGFVAITTATTRRDMVKAGMLSRNRPAPRPREKGGSAKGWLMLSIVLVLTTWSSTGLLGFYPTIVASGSMRPSIDVGDLAIVVETDQKNIVEGDIIQYWNEGEMTLHRVVEIERTKEAKYFITKGDANNIPDIVPVLPSQIKGKLLITIPKIGWVSIYSKTIVFGIWNLISYNTVSEYTAFTIAVVSISFVSIRRIKNNSNRKLSRRGW